MIDGGLQLARVRLNEIGAHDRYMFLDPENLNFTADSPSPKGSDHEKVYLPGIFSSGSIFYSSYFGTFVMIYFNKLADSTFYIRYLNTNLPVGNDVIWRRGGQHGAALQPEDVEALFKYVWSPQQRLYGTSPGKGGFNYAGMAHPEDFNRHYFGKSLYPDGTRTEERKNDWYGSKLRAESDAGEDGKHVLLSWTSHLHEGLDRSVYKAQLAVVEFDDISTRPRASTSATTSTTTHKPIDMNLVPKGSGTGSSWGSFLTCFDHTDLDALAAVEVFILLSLTAAGVLFW
ncbi:hypothetical protein MMC29_005072 [Sticta canariensis]|nr:hypothetical protein [Sticta canariensis]